MNYRNFAHTGASLALIVLSTGTTTSECDQREYQIEQEQRARYSSRVTIRADDDTCWRIRVDNRTHSGCGDAGFYPRRSDCAPRVEKIDGNDVVRISLTVNGRTIDRKTVERSGNYAVVHYDRDADNNKDNDNKDEDNNDDKDNNDS